MEWESSLELDNLVSTPSDAGFPFHSPSSDIPPVQPSHMNIDQPQPQQGDLRPSVAAVEMEPGFEPENFVTTPSDAEFLPPSSSSDISHPNIDRRQSAIAAAIESWEPPSLSSTLTDQELVVNYLRTVLEPSGFTEESQSERLFRWSATKNAVKVPQVVNAGLPSMNPLELPGITAGKEGSREKYYLTDHHHLCRVARLHADKKIVTRGGFWLQNEVCVVEGSSIYRGGIKKTYIWKDTSKRVDGIKSNWIMNVYGVFNDDARMEEELVLCHVFEASPAKGPTAFFPFVQGGRGCSGKHHHEGIDAWTNTPFSSIHRGSSPKDCTPITFAELAHHGPDWHSDHRLSSFMADLEGFMLGGPDHDPVSSMGTESCIPTRGISPTDDPGQSNKRKKKSDVWDYFSEKIYAHDLQGNVVTLAACNHCSRVLTADSKSGTRHLLDHTCPCKFKPVQAGRKDKGVVNVFSPQAS